MPVGRAGLEVGGPGHGEPGRVGRRAAAARGARAGTGSPGGRTAGRAGLLLPHLICPGSGPGLPRDPHPRCDLGGAGPPPGADCHLTLASVRATEVLTVSAGARRMGYASTTLYPSALPWGARPAACRPALR